MSGFTLIETLVVLAIVAILAAICIPVSRKAIDQARTIQCAGQEKEIGVAMSLYLADHHHLPASPAPYPGSFWYYDWVLIYAPYIKSDYNQVTDYHMKPFWCPSYVQVPGGPVPGPFYLTSYWLGDVASGNQTYDPPVPFPIAEFANRHILREQSFYHQGNTCMNLLYLDGHVESYNQNAPYPP